LDQDQLAHWNRYARQWAKVGPPLRPSAEDLAWLRDRIARALPRTGRVPTALLLGVTPEVAAVDWRPEINLIAVDQAPGMIATVWPGDTPRRWAICADWLALPIAAATIDAAIGDGCFNVLAYPEGYLRLAAALADALRPGGLLAVRNFCRPERQEDPAAVFDDLEQRIIGSFHAFKWRLVMAVQGQETSRGAPLAEVWRAFAERVRDPAALAARLGWSPHEVSGLEGYRDSKGSYSFPTVDEVTAVLSERFELIERWHGGYELAARCPQFLLRAR